MHGPCLPPDMEEEDTKPLKITTLNVKNIESNMQYIYKLFKSTDILCLQETWLFNFQLRQLSEIHKGKFKKNVTIQFFYPHALNLQYFYLHLLLKCVF